MRVKQTFVLEVTDTQNQSWQGKIEWIQGRKRQSFRSVMELLRLIDSVVYDETGECRMRETFAVDEQEKRI